MGTPFWEKKTFGLIRAKLGLKTFELRERAFLDLEVKGNH